MPPDPPPYSFTRYLAIFGATLVGVIGLVWAYTAMFPMAFMESGYASWAAKRAMVAECRLGQVAFFGDSRLEAGVMPAALPMPASNIGLAAGTAIELRASIDRALACPEPPKQAVLSLVPEHFGPLSRYYWLLSIRYGYLSPGDVLAVERLAGELGDRESLATHTPDGLSGPIRDWAYALRFPSLSFGSLVQGRLAGRWEGNRARLDTVEAARGWTPYVGGDKVKAEHPDRFIATRLQLAELEAAIAVLKRRGVSAALLIMPFAPNHQETDAVLDAYRATLAAIAQRAGATLLDPVVPIWPERAFADGAHLDPDGARAFTARLAACAVDGLLTTPCNLSPDAATAAATE